LVIWEFGNLKIWKFEDLKIWNLEFHYWNLQNTSLMQQLVVSGAMS